MLTIKLVEEGEFAELLRFTDALGGVQVRNRFRAGQDACALIHGRHEAGAPVARAVHDGAVVVLHHDERREILVEGP